MNQQSNIAILILAAGNSSRMGRIKQLLPWKNSCLLNHTINTVVQLERSKNFVVLGANYERIKAKIKPEDFQVIYNYNWKLGLGNSIAFGVNHIKNKHQVDAVLIVLADQPLIDASYLNKLMTSFETEKKQIIASSYGSSASGEKLGVPALFDNCYFEELSKLNQDKGAKKVIGNHLENVSIINANDLISDIDTIEDYERLYQKHH